MRHRSWPLLISLMSLSSVLYAQSSSGGAPASSTAGPEGKDISGYHVEQSIEFGYRFTDLNGSGQMYNTLINQQEGPRLLDQTLSMHSLENSGVLFDDL